MINTKPIHILRTFSSAQLVEFEKYLSSPVFNTNKMVIQLFDIVKVYAPNFDSEQLHRNTVYAKLFGKDQLDESKLRYVSSDLAQVLEEYISWFEFQKSRQQKNLFLLDYYRKADLERYFNQILDEENKLQEKNSIKDSTWFFHQYLLEENAYQYSQQKKSRSLDNNLQTLVDYLDLFYISNKLKHSGEMLTREVLLRIKYKKPLLDSVLEFLKEDNIQDFLAVELYHNVIQMHLYPDETNHYYRLLELLETNRNNISNLERVDLFVFAQNYCTAQINSGKTEFLKEVFNLYKKMIEQDAIYDDSGHIRLNVFKNIVTVGIRLEEFEFVESFIEGFKSKLDADKRESAIQYNMAWLNYAKKDYKGALRLLSMAEFADIFYLLGSKCLQLKIFLETEEYDAFYALCESFYVFLRRNKVIADYQKDAHLEFIKYIKQLGRIKMTKNMNAAAKLYTNLQGDVGLIDRSWFLKKVEEINPKLKN